MPVCENGWMITGENYAALWEGMISDKLSEKSKMQNRLHSKWPFETLDFNTHG